MGFAEPEFPAFRQDGDFSTDRLAENGLPKGVRRRNAEPSSPDGEELSIQGASVKDGRRHLKLPAFESEDGKGCKPCPIGLRYRENFRRSEQFFARYLGLYVIGYI